MSFIKSGFLNQYRQSLWPRFFALFALNLGIYTFLRVVFLVWNHKSYADLTFLEGFWVFAHGLRFDLAVVTPLSTLMFFLFQIRNFVFRQVLFWILVGFHVLVLLANFVDIELVNFVGRRLTKSTLYLVGEGNVTNLMVYLPMTIITFLILFFYIFCVYRIAEWPQKKWPRSWIQKIFLVFGFVVVTLIFSRGGLQEKPISFVDAKVVNHPQAHHAILNSTFTLLKSLGQKSFERVRYFDEPTMLSYLNVEEKTSAHSSNPHDFQNYNLVIFILESFSSEYINSTNTPFLLSLAEKGSYYPKAYANGRRSIEGIASILSGIPALMEDPFVNSPFASQDFVGLGHLLRQQNYHTSFFHGAKNGSMRFDLFTKAAGFDHYFGMNEFNDQSQHDGSWGIWDEPFFQWSCEKISAFAQPFSSVIFSLTSHQPYRIPEKYKNQFVEGAHPILKAIRYTDYSVQKFFECAQKKAWFQKTLFVFVADHTGPSLQNQPSFVSQYQVPILFYSTNQIKPLPTEQLAQHIDLLPTLNELMGLGLQKKNYLARSLTESGEKVIALYSDGHYELVSDRISIDKENTLKAVRQYFSEGLYDSRLYYPIK